MYSRDFSDKTVTGLPPQYGGTAFGRSKHREPPAPPPCQDTCHSECQKKQEPESKKEEHCPPPPPRPESAPILKGILGRLLPGGHEGSDILLVGLALLLLSDGCEDELLPLILLFLLLIH